MEFITNIKVTELFPLTQPTRVYILCPFGRKSFPLFFLGCLHPWEGLEDFPPCYK